MSQGTFPGLQPSAGPKLRQLIEQAGAGAEQHVSKAKSQYLDQVRAVLRDLTRLKFSERQGKESRQAAIPIKVSPGLPEPLEKLADQELETDEKWGIELIGLWKHDFALLESGCRQLRPLISKLQANASWKERAADYAELVSGTELLVKELRLYAAQAELLKQISGINEDVLGVYRATSKMFPDRGFIELYWLVIGAVARLLGVETEALTVVVLTHELAHAYTHLGLDSNAKRWEEGFWVCKTAIIEGLAQYYTHKAILALQDERGYEGVWKAYDALTQLQRKNGAVDYIKHLPWVETISPEAVRMALLDLRQGHVPNDFALFNDALECFATRYPLKSKRPIS